MNYSILFVCIYIFLLINNIIYTLYILIKPTKIKSNFIFIEVNDAYSKLYYLNY